MGKLPTLDQFEDVECKGCDEGVAMCRGRPCWPTPPEVRKLIAAGYAKRLMLDHWAGSIRFPNGIAGLKVRDVEVVCPANPGYEAKSAATMDHPDDLLERFGPSPLGQMFALMVGTAQQAGAVAELKSGCTFLSDEGLCGLHDEGLKPAEGRKACCKDRRRDDGSIRKAVTLEWETPEGRAVVAEWRKAVGL